MLRLIFTLSLFFTITACSGCDDTSSSDGSAQVQDAGSNDDGGARD